MFFKKKTDDAQQDLSQLPAVVVRDEDASGDIAIQFQNVTKTYKLFKNDKARFKAAVLGSTDCKTVNANNDLTFTVKRGEGVAFLGFNGAGKSTTLKIITGVVHPTHGRVEVHGRVGALLELQAGFDMQLTGRENIWFRGQIWGLSNQEIAELEPKVVEFAELGDYIDQPMRTYSSGMKARLGFAFVSSIKPDILIVDEALAVGDRRFNRKCLERVREIMSDQRVTVLFVTHSNAYAKEFCQKGIVLDKGTALFEGDINEALGFYKERQQ